jgi:hypothetical protein
MVAFGGEGTAGFQTCCIADVPIGGAWKSGARLSGGRHAGLKTRDTAGLETCGTTMGKAIVFSPGAISRCAQNHRGSFFFRASVAAGVYLHPSFLWLL